MSIHSILSYPKNKRLIPHIRIVGGAMQIPQSATCTSTYTGYIIELQPYYITKPFLPNYIQLFQPFGALSVQFMETMTFME